MFLVLGLLGLRGGGGYMSNLFNLAVTSSIRCIVSSIDYFFFAKVFGVLLFKPWGNLPCYLHISMYCLSFLARRRLLASSFTEFYYILDILLVGELLSIGSSNLLLRSLDMLYMWLALLMLGRGGLPTIAGLKVHSWLCLSKSAFLTISDFICWSLLRLMDSLYRFSKADIELLERRLDTEWFSSLFSKLLLF